MPPYIHDPRDGLRLLLHDLFRTSEALPKMPHDAGMHVLGTGEVIASLVVHLNALFRHVVLASQTQDAS